MTKTIGAAITAAVLSLMLTNAVFAQGTALVRATVEHGGTGAYWDNDEQNPGESKCRLVSSHHAAHFFGNKVCVVSTTTDNNKPAVLRQISFEVQDTIQARKHVAPAVVVEYEDNAGQTKYLKLERNDFAPKPSTHGRSLWSHDFSPPLKIRQIAIGGREQPARILGWETTATMDCTISRFRAIDASSRALQTNYGLQPRVIEPGQDPLLKDLDGTLE
jgi:hypothetical protein